MAESGHTHTSATVMARLEQKRNEDLVLAESALQGERRVTVARLFMIGLFALSSAVLSPLLGERLPKTFARLGSVGAYTLFAIVQATLLRTRKPNARMARWMPVMSTFVDFSFLAFEGWLDWHDTGVVRPEMGAASFALVLCFAVARMSWAHVALATAVASGAYLGLSIVMHILSPISLPFVIGAFLGLGFLMGMTNISVRRMFTGLRRRDNLTRFLPRAVADAILAGGDAALAPVQREVTVLFSDIRDFTAFSEALPPREVLLFLDEYFGHMGQIVKGHDGVVGKLMGDGMLAFWGVPERMPDHAERAVRAALDMRKLLVEWNQVRVNAGAHPVKIGIGVHTGMVAAGMLGGADQHEYTIIGDAVNVASRIEGLTKQHGVDLLVTESTMRLLGADFGATRLTEETIRGRKDPVVVYTVPPAA